MANHKALPILSPKQACLISIDLGRSAAQHLPGHFQLLDITPLGARVLDNEGQEGLLVVPPIQLLAVLVGEGGVARTRALIAWLQAGGQPCPLVLEWQRETEVACLQRINHELGQLLAASKARQEGTSAEVVRMRGINGEIHHRFRVAESALLRTGTMPLDIVFANEPMTEPSQHIALGDTDAGVAQIVPVPSNGVSAIAVHLSMLPEAAAGSLVAHLASLEDGRTVERWAVPAADLVPGWNVLALSRALSGQSRTLELRLSRLSADDRLPTVSLGGGQPIHGYQVRDLGSGQPLLRNSLALQVWRGLPGTALPGWFKAHQPRRLRTAAGGYVDVPVAPLDLTKVEHANPEEVGFDFPAVLGPAGENTILCHAPVEGMTLARLPTAMPAKTLRFAASAFIDNQQSRDIDFALIIAADTVQAKAMAEGLLEPSPQEAFSGWCQVGNRQMRRLSAIREDSSGEGKFFVATRMSRPGDNSFARARFKDLSVMVQA